MRNVKFTGGDVMGERECNPKSTLDTLWSGRVITEEAIQKSLDEAFAHRDDLSEIKNNGAGGINVIPYYLSTGTIVKPSYGKPSKVG